MGKFHDIISIHGALLYYQEFHSSQAFDTWIVIDVSVIPNTEFVWEIMSATLLWNELASPGTRNSCVLGREMLVHAFLWTFFSFPVKAVIHRLGERRVAINFCMKLCKFAVDCVRPEIADNWKLHNDNAPTHTSSGWHVSWPIQSCDSSQPAYSAAMAPLDFFLFPRMKTPMQGHDFGTVNKVKKACTKALRDIPEKATLTLLMHGDLVGSNVVN